MTGMNAVGLWLALIVVVVISILLAVGSIWLANRNSYESRSKEHNSSLAPFVTTVALVYGALLGFTVVVAWEQFSSAKANVAAESSTLATMYRQTVGMSAPDQTKMQELLRRYAIAVQGEWSNRDSDGTSETARATITQMYRVLGGQQSNAASNPVNGQFLSQLTVLGSERNTRFLDIKPRIPGLLWGGLLFGGVVLVGLMGFARAPSRQSHVILSSAVAALLGLLLFIVFWLDHPFGRHLGVTPGPFDQALLVFDAIDQGI